jgi:hypothetical protein
MAGRDDKEWMHRESSTYQRGKEEHPTDPALIKKYESSVEAYLLKAGDKMIQEILLPSLFGPILKQLNSNGGSQSFNVDRLTGALATRMYGAATGRAEIESSNRGDIAKAAEQKRKEPNKSDEAGSAGGSGNKPPPPNDSTSAAPVDPNDPGKSKPTNLHDIIAGIVKRLDTLDKETRRGFGLDEFEDEWVKRQARIGNKLERATRDTGGNTGVPPGGLPEEPRSGAMGGLGGLLLSAALGGTAGAALGIPHLGLAVAGAKAAGRFATKAAIPLGVTLAARHALLDQRRMSVGDIDARGGFAASSVRSFGEHTSFGLSEKLNKALDGTAISTAIGMATATAMAPFSEVARSALTTSIKEAADKVFNSDLARSITGVFSSIGGYFAGNIPKPIQNAADWVGGKVTNAADWVGGKVTGAWDAVKNYTGLGSVAAHEESGGAGFGAVSSGKGDLGGASYGKYQLTSKTGKDGNSNVWSFLTSSGYAPQFAGLKPGTPAFDAKWKEIAAKDPKFGEAQQGYIKKQNYDPMMRGLKKDGIDLSTRGKAVQELVFATGTQYGGYSRVMKEALRGKDVNKMSDEEIVKTVQDYKGATVGQYFKSSPTQQASISARIKRDDAALTALAKDGGGRVGVSKAPMPTPKPVQETQKQSNSATSVPAPTQTGGGISLKDIPMAPQDAALLAVNSGLIKG